MEGKLYAEGLQAMDEDSDLLTAMARELMTQQKHRRAGGRNVASVDEDQHAAAAVMIFGRR
jgi:hypothetical protein